MDDIKKICVIGAGLAGLTSVKCLVDEGFNVKCFEKDSHVGGRWNSNNDIPIPRSTITNVPNFMSGYSDFPMPEKYPLFMSADQFSEYFDLYADEFGLRKHISFNTEVISVEQNNVDIKSKWTVAYRGGDGSLCNEEFDFVVVSSGFYRMPYIPGTFKRILEDFTGRVIHSVEYVNWKPFENQRVVVCGLGNTGGDIASELADHCIQVYVSTSNGAVVVPRICAGGSLTIENSTIRIADYIPHVIKNVIRKKGVNKVTNTIYSMKALHLNADDAVSSVIVNDEIGIRISSGKVKVRTGIEKINGKAIHFKDGKIENDIDAIILCTGYKRSFSFFKQDDIQIEKHGKYIPLYKGIFTSKYGSNLAFIGMASQFAPFAITAEMQVRYAAEVFKKRITLPNKQKMEECIQAVEIEVEAAAGRNLKEYNFMPNPWTYFDELAGDIGCRPSLTWILLTDPKLAWHLLGQHNLFEYRLVGPNNWPGAREEIINKAQRMYAFMDH